MNVRTREGISASVAVRSSAHFILSEIILSDILMFRKYTFSLFQGTLPSLLHRMMVRLASVSRVPRISWGWLSLFLCCTLGFYTTYACQDSSLVLHCPQNSIINIQSAFYGRRSDKICPYGEGASGKLQRWESKRERLKCSCRSLMDWMNLAGVCTVEGTLALARMMCDNREFCFLFAHTDSDPCPTVSKYLEVVFSCEQNGEDTAAENMNMI